MDPSKEFIVLCKAYSEREQEFTPLEALTLLTDAYMGQCGLSMTYRTLIEGASWYWQKLLGESDHNLANFASRHSFTQLMPYLSEEFNKQKEHYWEYDIDFLDSDIAVEAAQCYLKDIDGNENLKTVFAIGFVYYVEWLKNEEIESNRIMSEHPDVALSEFIDLDKLTDKQIKNILIGVENEIKSLLGNDPLSINLDSLDKNQMKTLEELLSRRCVLLDRMFLGTDNELTHLRQVNNHLLSLRNELHRRTTALKHSLIADSAFDDDTEIEGQLSFNYNGEDSVLKLEEDDYYGSDFELMCSVLASFYDRKCLFGNIGIGISPDTENTLDDGVSWIDPPFDSNRFKGIIIGYALNDLCHHKSFSIPDAIRLNDFWAEVVVRVQSITTQSGKRMII